MALTERGPIVALTERGPIVAPTERGPIVAPTERGPIPTLTEHPPIEPVAGDGPRPFWSVMIPTREPHPGYLAEAVDAVLAQDPGPEEMEIAVVDDASTRIDPRACLGARAARRIAWLRRERHGGMAENWNACIRRARGRWVHILHQDDLVRPGFYAALRHGIESAPAVGAAFCRDVVIGERGEHRYGQRLIQPAAGVVEDWIEHVFVELHLRASALVVRRDVYEALGGFRPDLRYALDWDMWKRVAAAYPMWYEPRELACYRRHRGSATPAFVRTGANIAEIRRSIELSERALPAGIAAAVARRARRWYTTYAVMTAWRAFAQRDVRGGLAQIREARRLTSSLAVARALCRIVAGTQPVAR